MIYKSAAPVTSWRVVRSTICFYSTRQEVGDSARILLVACSPGWPQMVKVTRKQTLHLYMCVVAIVPFIESTSYCMRVSENRAHPAC